MMGISKGMVVAAAAIAFGIVALEDMAKGAVPAFSFTEAQAATTDADVMQNGALRRRAVETLRALVETQERERGARSVAMSQKCRNQSWPYYSSDCLVRRDGAEVAPAARIVRIDRVVVGSMQTAELR